MLDEAINKAIRDSLEIRVEKETSDECGFGEPPPSPKLRVSIYVDGRFACSDSIALTTLLGISQ